MTHSKEDWRGHTALHCWFGLSYASFLTLPRVLMYEMSDEWQGRMAALLKEYDETFTKLPDISTTVRCTRRGKLIPFPDWLLNYRYPKRDVIDAFRAASLERITGEEGYRGDDITKDLS